MQKAFKNPPRVGDTVVFIGPLPEQKETTGKVVVPGLLSLWAREETGEGSYKDHCVTPLTLVRVKEAANG